MNSSNPIKKRQIEDFISDSTQTALNAKVNKAGDIMTGALTASMIVIAGGTSSQFLKADGTLDSNIYEDLSNKVDVITGTSSINYTTENAVVSYVNSSVSPLIRDQFVYTSGTQSFTLSQNYSQVYEVSIQGGGALHTDQYTLTAPNILTVVDPLTSGDYIVVLFTAIASGTMPYYSQAQVDALLAPKMDKVRTTKIVSTDTYTLLSSDGDKILYFTATSSVTVTIPSGLTLGNCYELFQHGTGQLTFVASGTTLRYSSQELLQTAEQYALVGIDSITNVTEEYHIYGQLVPI